MKKIRQEKGFSLEEVQKKTKIHLNILKAIEGDSLTNLSPIYLKGFLKIYCKFLKVDPKGYPLDHKEAAAGELLSIAPTQGEDKVLKSPSFFKNAGIKLGTLRPNKRMKTIIIYILAIAIFSAALFKLGKFISLRSKAIPLALQSQGQKPQVKTKAKPKNTTAPKPQLAEAKLLKESNGGVSLVISAKENCLIFVKVDGRVVLHRVLEKGRSDSWKAKEKIEFSLSNAAAVELLVNGQRFTNLGRRGQQLKNIVITEKDGFRIPR